MDRKVRIIFLVFGVIMILNSLLMLRVIPPVPFVLLIIGGLLLIWAAYGGRMKRLP
jgi:hypothetical protein